MQPRLNKAILIGLVVALAAIAIWLLAFFRPADSFYDRVPGRIVSVRVASVPLTRGGQTYYLAATYEYSYQGVQYRSNRVACIPGDTLTAWSAKSDAVAQLEQIRGALESKPEMHIYVRRDAPTNSCLFLSTNETARSN